MMLDSIDNSNEPLRPKNMNPIIQYLTRKVI